MILLLLSFDLPVGFIHGGFTTFIVYLPLSFFLS